MLLFCKLNLLAIPVHVWVVVPASTVSTVHQTTLSMSLSIAACALTVSQEQIVKTSLILEYPSAVPILVPMEVPVLMPITVSEMRWIMSAVVQSDSEDRTVNLMLVILVVAAHVRTVACVYLSTRILPATA